MPLAGTTPASGVTAAALIELPPPPPAKAKPAVIQDNWVEIEYLYSDGTGVAGAAYVVEADGFKADGTLDSNGFARIKGIPASVSTFSYRFLGDPGVYAPQPPAASTAKSRAALGDALDWLWGTIQGDFNKDPSISQTAVNTLIGLIPIADQVLDVRDLVAGILALVDYYGADEADEAEHPDLLGLSYETWLWLGLFLIAIGCIPVLGSAIKGVLKMLIKALQDLGQAAGKLSAAQLAKIWADLLAVLNKLGVKPGNAHRWLKTLRSELPNHLDAAAGHIRGAVETLDAFLVSVKGHVEKLARWGIGGAGWAARSVEAIGQTRRALTKALSRLEDQKQAINQWLGSQLGKVIDAAGFPPSTGRVNTTPSSAINRIQQNATEPGEPEIPPIKRKKTPSEEARDWQGGDSIYRGVDDYTDTILKEGEIIYGGVPGQSNYYIREEALTSVDFEKNRLWEGLQVRAHPQFGHRKSVQAYRVREDAPAAIGQALKNSDFGKGGLEQVYVPDFEKYLEPVGNPISLK